MPNGKMGILGIIQFAQQPVNVCRCVSAARVILHGAYTLVKKRETIDGST